MEGTVKGRIVLRGRTPLMLNRMTEDKFKKISTGDKSSDDEQELKPEERARRRVHTDDEGNSCLTSAVILETLKNAGRYVQYQGKRNVTAGDGTTLLYSFFGLFDERFPIRNPKNGKPAKWVPDQRLVPQKSSGRGSGGSTVVTRAKFPEWQAAIEFWFDPKGVNATKVRRLFEEACSKVGFASGRTIGMGRAEIVEYEVEPHEEAEEQGDVEAEAEA